MADDRPHNDRCKGPGAHASGPLPVPAPSDEPVYSMGRAAALLRVTQAYLRSLDAAGIVVARRSHGGHRRYSAHQLAIAARVREVLDEGLPLAAAGRIVLLEDRLAAAYRRIAELGGDPPAGTPAGVPHQARNGTFSPLA